MERADQFVEARYAELSDTVEQIAHRVGHSRRRPSTASFNSERWPVGEPRTPLQVDALPTARNVVRSSDEARDPVRVPLDGHEVSFLWSMTTLDYARSP